MSTVRIRIVLPVSDSPIPGFVGWSATIHVLGFMALLFLPGLFAPDRPALLPTIDAVLIAPDSGPPKVETPVAAPTPPPQKKAPPPEGPSAVPIEPPTPRELPPEKPKIEPKPRPVEPPPTKPAPVSGPPTSDEPIDAGESSGPIGSPEAGAALEGMGAEFDWYRDAVVRALFTSWRRPFARGLAEPLEVAISFEILRDGSVRGVQITSPSGDSRLDRSAFRAVQEASLPPLPRNYRVDTQAAQFAFRLYPENEF